jgi:hypothetical protein
VRQALSGYSDDPEGAEPTDFTPTAVLYAAYCAWCNSFDVFGRDSRFLSVREFGAALVRVFPNLDDGFRGSTRTRRRVNGVLTYGYCGLKGPGSVTTYDRPGNPKLSPAKAPAPTAQVSGSGEGPPAADCGNAHNGPEALQPSDG